MTKLYVLLVGLCVALGVTLACFFAALALVVQARAEPLGGQVWKDSAADWRRCEEIDPGPVTYIVRCPQDFFTVQAGSSSTAAPLTLADVIEHGCVVKEDGGCHAAHDMPPLVDDDGIVLEKRSPALFLCITCRDDIGCVTWPTPTLADEPPVSYRGGETYCVAVPDGQKWEKRP